MNWAGVITAILSFLSKLFDVFKSKQLQETGVAAQASAQKDQVIENVDKVHEAQVAFDDRAAANPSSVLDDPAGYYRD